MHFVCQPQCQAKFPNIAVGGDIVDELIFIVNDPQYQLAVTGA
jgi:hypothetical protein